MSTFTKPVTPEEWRKMRGEKAELAVIQWVKPRFTVEVEIEIAAQSVHNADLIADELKAEIAEIPRVQSVEVRCVMPS